MTNPSAARDRSLIIPQIIAVNPFGFREDFPDLVKDSEKQPSSKSPVDCRVVSVVQGDLTPPAAGALMVEDSIERPAGVPSGAARA